jgi:hypothetical protein
MMQHLKFFIPRIESAAVFIFVKSPPTCRCCRVRTSHAAPQFWIRKLYAHEYCRRNPDDTAQRRPTCHAPLNSQGRLAKRSPPIPAHQDGGLPFGKPACELLEGRHGAPDAEGRHGDDQARRPHVGGLSGEVARSAVFNTPLRSERNRRRRVAEKLSRGQLSRAIQVSTLFRTSRAISYGLGETLK